MSKYTPGPWEVDESNPNLVARLVDGVYEYVCEVARSSFSTRECSDEQEEADARLIAAAPELLEAAKLVIAWYEAGDDHSKADFFQRLEIERRARGAIAAAIAKATGEQA